jgi:hypothetical protein
MIVKRALDENPTPVRFIWRARPWQTILRPRQPLAHRHRRGGGAAPAGEDGAGEGTPAQSFATLVDLSKELIQLLIRGPHRLLSQGGAGSVNRISQGVFVMLGPPPPVLVIGVDKRL